MEFRGDCRLTWEAFKSELNVFIYSHVGYTWGEVYTFYFPNDIAINIKNIINIMFSIEEFLEL